jgi:hypothetical protein
VNSDQYAEQARYELAWMLSHRPENRRVAEYIKLLGIPNAANVYQIIASMVRMSETPVNGFNAQVMYELTIGYHELVAQIATPTEECAFCGGEQEVVSYGGGRGFAGGSIHFTELACGHTNVDESDDVRAAY